MQSELFHLTIQLLKAHTHTLKITVQPMRMKDTLNCYAEFSQNAKVKVVSRSTLATHYCVLSVLHSDDYSLLIFKKCGCSLVESVHTRLIDNVDYIHTIYQLIKSSDKTRSTVRIEILLPHPITDKWR